MMLQCIKYKKPVLCEKAFTLNTEQAKKVFEQAEKNKVFVAEAIWTRYMPMRKTINDVLNSGIIGTPKFLEANLSYFRDNKPRLQNPEAAGGALLEIGIYPLNFALMAFGDKIKSEDSSVFINDNGVDEQETITINFEDGKMASLNSSIAVNSNRKGIISGDKGYIEIENINNPESLSVYDAEYHKIKSILCPTQITWIPATHNEDGGLKPSFS